MFINLGDLLKIEWEKAGKDHGSVPWRVACIQSIFSFLCTEMCRTLEAFQSHGLNFYILSRGLERVKGLPSISQQVAVKLALLLGCPAPTRSSPPFLQNRVPTTLLGVWRGVPRLTDHSQCSGRHESDPSPLWFHHSTVIHGAPAI